jgi:hypothetical protein
MIEYSVLSLNDAQLRVEQTGSMFAATEERACK